MNSSASDESMLSRSDNFSEAEPDNISSDAAERDIYVHKRGNKQAAASDSYELACQKLQLNAISDELPCRDDERKKILEYIKSGLKQMGSSSSLYISGMPGTGKTVTTL